jgi:hypothetical protein
VLNWVRWSSLALAHVLREMIVRTFATMEAVVIGLDDTLQRRRGQKSMAKGIYRDPVRSSHSHLVKASGLRWLCAMVLAEMPWETKLIPLACSPPPAGHAGWSLRLLEHKVVELKIVDHASDNTIGRVLKKHSQAAPQTAMGDSARAKQCVRSGAGGGAGGLSTSARPGGAAGMSRRMLQAAARRYA